MRKVTRVYYILHTKNRSTNILLEWHLPTPPPTILVSHVPFAMQNASNHSLPLKLYISHRVWLVCSYTGQFHHRSHSDNYGHNSWDTLLKWRPVSVIWKILLPRPPPPCTMLKLGFETGDWSLTLFGEVGGGTDSHKTCKRLLITVEITFSYFSLKYYQVSQGLMAIIVYRPVWKRKRLSLRM